MKLFSNERLFVITLLALFCGVAVAQNTWKVQNNKKGDKVEVSYEANSTSQIFIGYASVNSQIYLDDGIGGLTQETKVGAAIKLTRPMLDKYIGAKIIALNAGWCNREHTAAIECFIREELQGENLTTGKGNLEFGWNKNEFNESYTIPEDIENLYIGYYATIPEKAFVIPTFWSEEVVSDACYLWCEGDMTGDGKEAWIDFTKNYGVLSIHAIVEGEPGKYDNMLEIESVQYYDLQTIGKSSSSVYTITNHGMNNIESLELSYQKDGEKWNDTFTLNQAIIPSETKRINLPVYALGTGKQTAGITKVNGEDNKIATSYELDILGIAPEVAEDFIRRPLVEYWESENSFYVPTYYSEYFYPGFEPYADRLSLVSHHLGDQFMQGDDEDVKMMLDFVNNDSMRVTVPAMSVDRTNMFTILGIDSYSPAMPTVFPDLAYIVYDPALAIPTFASVNVEAFYNEENLSGEINVKGRIASGVTPNDESLYLTVYVLENGIVSDSQEFWDKEEEAEYGGLYIHDNVIRSRPTPLYGVEIGNGGEYVQDFTVQFEPDWKPENMRVVAFINRDVKNDVKFDGEIINAGECTFFGVSSINNLYNETKILLYTKDGKICAEGEYDYLTVFDLAGRLVNNENLVKGIYLVKISNNNRDFMQKVLVK